ncbi:MAG: sugar phosphate isomerase/epimerase [Lachnospiraceae bacterium]|nr:sugar phosphate isomerase/epimerase [Lachnospiraceae bacterium]
MYTNLNPRTMGLNHHPYEVLLPAAKAAGFGGIEVPAHAFGSVPAAKDAGKALAGQGMRFGLMMAPCDMFKAEDAVFEEALAQWARWLERARAAGCTKAYNHFWPGSDSRPYEENFEWHRRRLQRIFHIMEENGIFYGLEFMGAKTVRDGFRYPFAATLGETLALADSVSSRIGVVFDTIHWYTSGMAPEDLEWAAGMPQRVVNLHLNDAFPRRSATEQIDSERALPGESGVIDAVAVVRAFHLAGYDGPVILEPMAPATKRWEKMEVSEAAKEGADCLRGILRKAGADV